MPAITFAVTAKLDGQSTFSSLTPDVLVSDGLSIEYGIPGNRPTDRMASSGRCAFTLRNDSLNSGRTQGWYSPRHPNVRLGWTHGIQVRVYAAFEAEIPVALITRTDITVTVTTSIPHGFDVSEFVIINGSTGSGAWAEGVWEEGAWIEGAWSGPGSYDGVWSCSITGPSTFTFQIPADTPTPDVGAGITAQRCYVKFMGRIDTIDPEPGVNGAPRVRVIAYDAMRDIIDADVSNIALQINKFEDEIIIAVIDALPEAIQPSFSITTGQDMCPVALDDIGTGVKAGTIINDLAVSSYGLVFVRGTGKFTYMSRNELASLTSSFTFDNVMHGLEARSSQSNVYNDVKVVTHPREIDAAATTVLCSMAGTNPPLIPAGETVTFELAFRDPDDERTLIGGTDIVEPDADTDFDANSAPDGTGSDLSGSIAVVETAYASKAILAVENFGGTDAYLVDPSGDTLLQLRGKGIYNYKPRVFRATSGDADRSITIDLPYQADDTLGQQIAQFILSQYDDLARQVDGLTIVANYSDDFARYGLLLEPGHVITISETVTGVSSVNAIILSCKYDLDSSGICTVRWGLGPNVTISPPLPPTSLSAVTHSDTTVTLTWVTGTTGAYTQIYVNGNHYTTTGVGQTSIIIYGLTRATTYSFTVRHLYFGMTSIDSNTATGRPTIVATGGTITTPGDGYKYHTFTSSGDLVVTGGGRYDILLVGAGGGGGGGALIAAVEHGGGGGGGGAVRLLTDEQEPTGTHAIVIGASGSAGSFGSGVAGTNGTQGGDTSYRALTVRGGGYGAGGGSSAAGNNGNANSGVSGGSSGGGGAGDAGGAGGAGNSGAGNGGSGGNDPGNVTGGGGGGGSFGNGGNGGANGGTAGAGNTAFGGTYGQGGLGGRGTASTGGTANTGMGGGGGNQGANSGHGYGGGSGVVVIRYPI